eukprot:CAMPEP_0196759364 /NCGR_PEP_ID=MMETSP1091-20130531/104662_1 /TAXON_ID=302021 /ORGANISM="Rhodomonas sp., Strain CCMP768" /LENGTH=102 /DNA_ID=CAMNT_0042108213 /DNA_START=676 /DNA_END=980 /DNA_ORIENTATION=+
MALERAIAVSVYWEGQRAEAKVQEAGLNLNSPPQGPLAGHWQATGRSQAGLVLAVCYWHHDCASAGHGLAVSRILNLKHLLPWEGGPGWEVRPRSVQGETDP